MKKYLIKWVVLMVIFYLLGAFILWQLNPSKWHPVDRGLLAFGGTLLSACLSAIIIETYEDK